MVFELQSPDEVYESGRETVGEMWMFDYSSLVWRPVSFAGSAQPAARGFSSMAYLGQSGGLENALLVFGGSHECDLTQFQCVGDTLQPQNDVWLVDVTERPPSGSQDSDMAASFDGVDDIISLALPSWCVSTEMLNVLWMDMWLFFLTPQGKTTVLLDAVSNSNMQLLRWQIEALEGKLYGVLLLNTGPSQVQVRRWGPLEVPCKGVWRHVTFTLRTARVKNLFNLPPDLAIVQAYMFVDGKRVLEAEDTSSSGALVRLSQGVCSIFIGGPNPSSFTKSDAGKNLHGKMDNVRVWWPSCPSPSDPSKCNPYAFTSKLRDGALMPAAQDANGRPVYDSDVTLHMVAAPVFRNMLLGDVALADHEHLLVHLNFNGQTASERQIHNVASGGPMCPASIEQWWAPSSCESCKEECSWSNRLDIELDMVSSRGSDLASIAKIATTGTCQCQNLKDCPKNIRECQCPISLHRVCSKCRFAGVCRCTGAFCATPWEDMLQYGMAPRVWSTFEWFGCTAPETDIPGLDGTSPYDNWGISFMGLDPMWCPDDACQEWTCDCFDPTSMSGNVTSNTLSRPYGLHASVDSHTAVGHCPSVCPSGAAPEVPPSESQLGLNVCCQNGAAGPLTGKICLKWNMTIWDECRTDYAAAVCQEGLYLRGVRTHPWAIYAPPAPVCTHFLEDAAADCGIAACCHDSQMVSTRRDAHGVSTLFHPLIRDRDLEMGTRGMHHAGRGEGVTLLNAHRGHTARRQLVASETVGDECAGARDFSVDATESTREPGGLNEIAIGLHFLQDNAEDSHRAPSMLTLSGLVGSETDAQMLQVSTNQVATCSVDADCNYHLALVTASGVDLSGCTTWQQYECVSAQTCSETQGGGGERRIRCSAAQRFLATVTPGQGVCVQSKAHAYCQQFAEYSFPGPLFSSDGSFCVFGSLYRTCPSAVQAMWDQQGASLKVPININGSSSYPELWLHMGFKLRNRAAAQPAAHVEVEVCRRIRASTSAIFSSSLFHITASDSDTRLYLKAASGSSDELVASLYLPAGAMPQNSTFEIEIARSSAPGLAALVRRFPASAEVAARLKSVFTASVRREGGISAIETLARAASFHISLDYLGVVRRAGGCVTAGALLLCLEGDVGAYEYNPVLHAWQRLAFEVLGNDILVNVSKSSVFTVLAEPRCCVHEGQGKTCGDRSTLNSQCVQSVDGSLALFGGSTDTQRPTLTHSTKPSAFVVSATGATAASTYASGGWQQLCPRGASVCNTAVEEVNWPAPRLQHAMAAVSANKVLIYGGIGCQTYRIESRDRVCLSLSMVPLTDLWEFDFLKARAGFAPFRQIDLSPSHGGLLGASMARAGLSDNKLTVLGGSKSRNMAFESWSGLPMNPTEPQGMVVRDLLFNQRKASEARMLSTGELSFHSIASNATHAVLFGGFVRNAQSAATYVYSLGTSSVHSSLPSSDIRAVAPGARGFSAMIKLSYIKGDTLAVFGGVRAGEGLSDLWVLDLRTRAWALVHGHNAGEKAISNVAFSAIMLIQGTYLMSLGGLQGGYKSGVSFRSDATHGQMFQVLDQQFFWSRPLEPQYSQFRAFWGEMGPVFPPCCCGETIDHHDCVRAGFGSQKGCMVSARAMHSGIGGQFGLGNSEAYVVYGGVGRHGHALSDHWLTSLANDMHPTNVVDPWEGIMSGTMKIKMYLENITAATFNTAHKDFRTLMTCPVTTFDQSTGFHMTSFRCGQYEHLKIYDVKAVDIVTAAGDKAIKVTFKVWMTTIAGPGDDARAEPGTPGVLKYLLGIRGKSPAWICAYVPSEGCAQTYGNPEGHLLNASGWASLLEDALNSCAHSAPSCIPLLGTSLSEATWSEMNGDPAEMREINYLHGDLSASGDWAGYILDGAASYGMRHYEFKAESSCRGGVNEAHCMRGSCRSTSILSDLQFCYIDMGCPTGMECGLPPPLHGHSALHFKVQGQNSVQLVFGGESSDLVSEPGAPSGDSLASREIRLSADVYVTFYSAYMATWTRVSTTCDSDIGEEARCPTPRRNAATCMFGNTGSSNGRLLVFGGMSCRGGATCAVSGMLHYLEAIPNDDLITLNDLWTLDLGSLDSACLSTGHCQRGMRLPWTQVDVSGSRPSRSFGAGLIVDSSDRIFIMGGSAYEDQRYREVDGLYVFELRDPYYKYCSATGSGLLSAQAGVESVVYIQCKDALLEPADGASLKIDITGPSPITLSAMSPLPIALGGGV